MRYPHQRCRAARDDARPKSRYEKQIDSASGLVVKHRPHVLAFEVRKRVDPHSEHTRDAGVHSRRDRLADSVRQ